MTTHRWRIAGIALAAFAAGSFFTTTLMHLSEVRADSNRVFELRIYHTLQGKQPALVSEFRDKVTKLFAKHDLKALGFWSPADPAVAENTFIYILAHPSKEAADKHWAAFRADPEFQAMMKEQQAPDAKIVEKVDSTYMNPTDFSPVK